MSSYFSSIDISFHPDIAIKETPSTGLGLFATRPIAPHTTLLTVPRSAKIPSSLALQDPAFQPFAYKVPDTLLLAAYITKNYLSESPTPYAAAVFATVDSHPLVISDAAAAAIPDPDTRAEVMSLRKEAAAAASLLAPALGAGGAAGVVRGLAVVLSRSFNYDRVTLVPGLDLLNHASEPNISHKEAGDGSTVLTAGEDGLQAGEELVNEYCKAGTSDAVMYARFGFVP
ncbi:hypothetical protein TeGR_g3858 [Tetraparma gracilis]|uniref:SET domain-containing protein n=1 Tax=Tetraparma gracilis TaxID=2962635 RepID=A0ABQ6N1W0_9STRA|nr:hypothetical protein TeGR_g3858 [Tetraparma gracilis]